MAAQVVWISGLNQEYRATENMLRYFADNNDKISQDDRNRLGIPDGDISENDLRKYLDATYGNGDGRWNYRDASSPKMPRVGGIVDSNFNGQILGDEAGVSGFVSWDMSPDFGFHFVGNRSIDTQTETNVTTPTYATDNLDRPTDEQTGGGAPITKPFSTSNFSSAPSRQGLGWRLVMGPTWNFKLGSTWDAQVFGSIGARFGVNFKFFEYMADPATYQQGQGLESQQQFRTLEVLGVGALQGGFLFAFGEDIDGDGLKDGVRMPLQLGVAGNAGALFMSSLGGKVDFAAAQLSDFSVDSNKPVPLGSGAFQLWLEVFGVIAMLDVWAGIDQNINRNDTMSFEPYEDGVAQETITRTVHLRSGGGLNPPGTNLKASGAKASFYLSYNFFPLIAGGIRTAVKKEEKKLAEEAEASADAGQAGDLSARQFAQRHEKAGILLPDYLQGNDMLSQMLDLSPVTEEETPRVAFAYTPDRPHLVFE